MGEILFVFRCFIIWKHELLPLASRAEILYQYQRMFWLFLGCWAVEKNWQSELTDAISDISCFFSISFVYPLYVSLDPSVSFIINDLFLHNVCLSPWHSSTCISFGVLFGWVQVLCCVVGPTLVLFCFILFWYVMLKTPIHLSISKVQCFYCFWFVCCSFRWTLFLPCFPVFLAMFLASVFSSPSFPLFFTRNLVLYWIGHR